MDFPNSTCCTARYIDWLQVPQGDLVHEKNWNEQHIENVAELYYFSLESLFLYISDEIFHCVMCHKMNISTVSFSDSYYGQKEYDISMEIKI